MKIKKAAEYMREIGASFIFTGEVLGQRPMSQHYESLITITRESGIKGLILRPLSAAVLDETIPEKNGWVDRNLLLAISGRSRKPQIALAQEKGINDYPCPAGGCLLTDDLFAIHLKDYFAHTGVPRAGDIPLLKIGRHFRLDDGEKIIVARDSNEGDMMLRLLKNHHHIIFPQNFSAPAVLSDGATIVNAFTHLFIYTKKTVPENAVIEWRHAGTTTLLTRSQWPEVSAVRGKALNPEAIYI
jgi:hypothetical protein